MKKRIISADKNKEVAGDKEVSIVTEAVLVEAGVYRYTISSNKNLRLGICNISN